MSRPSGLGFSAEMRLVHGMTQDLVVGLISLTIAVGLLVIALPNKYGESPRFLRFHAAPML